MDASEKSGMDVGDWKGADNTNGRFSIRKTGHVEKDGRGDWIRTSDLSVPNRALYQAEPRPDGEG